LFKSKIGEMISEDSPQNSVNSLDVFYGTFGPNHSFISSSEDANLL
jgi:hypothetical protein